MTVWILMWVYQHEVRQPKTAEDFVQRAMQHGNWWLHPTSARVGATKPLYDGIGIFVLPNTWTRSEAEDFSLLMDMTSFEIEFTEDEYDTFMAAIHAGTQPPLRRDSPKGKPNDEEVVVDPVSGRPLHEFIVSVPRIGASITDGELIEEDGVDIAPAQSSIADRLPGDIVIVDPREPDVARVFAERLKAARRARLAARDE